MFEITLILDCLVVKVSIYEWVQLSVMPSFTSQGKQTISQMHGEQVQQVLPVREWCLACKCRPFVAALNTSGQNNRPSIHWTWHTVQTWHYTHTCRPHALTCTWTIQEWSNQLRHAMVSIIPAHNYNNVQPLPIIILCTMFTWEIIIYLQCLLIRREFNHQSNYVLPNTWKENVVHIRNTIIHYASSTRLLLLQIMFTVLQYSSFESSDLIGQWNALHPYLLFDPGAEPSIEFWWDSLISVVPSTGDRE